MHKGYQLNDNCGLSKHRRYDLNRLTSLAEMNRIYVYFVGNTKGIAVWQNELKTLYPEAERNMGLNTIWEFDAEKVWAVIQAKDSWKRMLDKQRIESFWELSLRVSPY